MKRIIFVLFLVFASRTAFAQLEVVPGSLKHVEGFVYTLLDRDKQYDENDKPTSLIKLKTVNINEEQRKRLKFAGDLQTAFMYDFKDGEVWIYLTSNPTYIKISHPDYSSCQYDFPFDLQPHQCYELTLANNFGNIYTGQKVNYLIVRSDQEDAMIYIDDVFTGEKEGFKVFTIGEKHNWRIECKLYYTEKGVVTITSGDPVTVEKKLRPAYGYLNITSEPESGATVFIDDEKVGLTPFKTNKLPSGDYTIKVVKEMYKPAERYAMVTDDHIFDIVMEMEPDFVNVTLTTDSESDIYVDEEYRGKGSWSGRLSAGTHLVEARKASHRSVKQSIDLVLGKDENITIKSPLPVYSDLDINSIPTGATIYIDGKNYGVTPKIISKILTGEHELKLEKEGYNTVTKKITLEEKNMLSLEEKLEKGVKMTIKTDKTGDRIFVNNDYMGLSPVSVNLPYGMNKIKAERNGETVEKEVNVLQDARETVINLTFEIKNEIININGVSFEMVYVKGGTFTMGGSFEQGTDADSNEKPVHQVTLSSYYIGKFEVTQGLWQAVMGTNPSFYSYGGNYPVEEVSWTVIVEEFLPALNAMTGRTFTLPTEAQWEFAARGGTKSKGYKYSGSNNIDAVAWYWDNTGRPTHPVGQKQPNELGIYDMSGNVWEWCKDWYDSDYYQYSPSTNPQGPSTGSGRVRRGGGWSSDADRCRVSNRVNSDPDYNNTNNGFRLVLLLPVYSDLNINTTPTGATIYIDGKNYGVTPKIISKILTGEHELKLEKEGYNTVTKKIKLEEKNMLSLEEELEKEIEIENEIININGVSFEMVYVKGGTFTMGGSSEQGTDAGFNEKPVHQVTLSGYYIGKFEVTQGLWQAVMGSNPSHFKNGNNYPVEYVSWNDCQEFIKKLNRMTGRTFALPTEAQWEFAARGGTKSKGYKYSGSNNIDDVAWYDEDWDTGSTHSVGQKQPNELGIYDMSGNVYEWCSDWYDENYYQYSPSTNPRGSSTGSARVLRGGCWNISAYYCRVSYRSYFSPDSLNYHYGFRLVLVP